MYASKCKTLTTLGLNIYQVISSRLNHRSQKSNRQIYQVVFDLALHNAYAGSFSRSFVYFHRNVAKKFVTNH